VAAFLGVNWTVQHAPYASATGPATGGGAPRFRPTVLVLAAGQSRRFKAAGGLEPGGTATHGWAHKLAQPFGASTVLGCTVRHAVESQLPVVVVTTAALAPLVAQLVPARCIVVLSGEEAARGMGHSIAAGVAEQSGAPGWLVLPGDMPLVQSNTLLAVASALEHHAVVYAEHRGHRGHPVGFAAELYSELVVLTGDDGARRIVARYPTYGQDVNDAGVLLDIDTPEDLLRLQQQVASA
jgi:molybdenum cofactor cytidylyltransferase